MWRARTIARSRPDGSAGPLASGWQWTRSCFQADTARTSAGPRPWPTCWWTSRRHTMIVEAQVTINGSKAAIWDAITNIENASEAIRGIDRIEVLEKPAHGLVGLKWRETRTLFGKPAAVEKWITDAAENEFYKTKAESHG